MTDVQDFVRPSRFFFLVMLGVVFQLWVDVSPIRMLKENMKWF